MRIERRSPNGSLVPRYGWSRRTDGWRDADRRQAALEGVEQNDPDRRLRLNLDDCQGPQSEPWSTISPVGAG